MSLVKSYAHSAYEFASPAHLYIGMQYKNPAALFGAAITPYHDNDNYLVETLSVSP